MISIVLNVACFVYLLYYTEVDEEVNQSTYVLLYRIVPDIFSQHQCSASRCIHHRIHRLHQHTAHQVHKKLQHLFVQCYYK